VDTVFPIEHEVDASIRETLYTFNALDELYKTAESLPEVKRQDIYAYHDELDEWEEIPYRDSLWTDDGRATGDISSSTDFYNVIQYDSILETVGNAIEQHQNTLDLDVDGSVSLSPTAHKMTASINFIGDTTVYAEGNDPIELGLNVRSGHSGFHGVKYDVGAERQVCKNGMVAFVAELSFEQTHQDSFQPELAYNAVDAIVESPETVEQRLDEAQNRELMNQDEALLVLLESGIDRYLEQPVPDLLNALQEEVEDSDSPTLWETYNAATRALTHYAEDVPGYELSEGYESVSQLLETGDSKVPDPDDLGGQVVENRANQLIENDSEEYWDGEHESIRELLEAHELHT